MQPAVDVQGLVVRHGDLTAVDGLELSVAPGEVLALLGPNGAGKTSAVETLEGYRRPDAGQVRILGLDPVDEHARLVASIGVMLQHGGVYPVMSPRQALELYAAYYEDPVAPATLLEELGLVEVAATPWRRLSGGEQQRTSLALALIGRPRVLFLDEPTAGVDLHGRAAIRRLVAEQRSAGVAVLVTTHEMAEAEAMADRVAIMHKGRLAKSGSMAELTGGGVRFQAPAGLDTTSLGQSLGSQVEESSAGHYKIASEASPSLVAALGSWLAQQGATMGELRSGASLEDAYTEVVGELAFESAPERPAAGGRRRSRR
jgi:ABC-2 type transport system ATP-binding protein